MTTRRDLLVLLGVAALTPQSVLGQSKQPIVIGWLSMNSRESGKLQLAAFKDGLAALGWKEGSQFVIEGRWADGRIDQLPFLAQELAAKKPAIIVAGPSQPVAEAAKAAPKTPIVHASGSDPVAAGFAASLARPGGMITGLTNINTDIQEKFVELLLAAAPKVKRIGFLVDTSFSRPRLMEAVRRSVAQYSVDARFAEAAKPEDIEPAIAGLAKEGVQALAVLSSGLFTFERQRIVKLALARRWPMIGGGGFAAQGALLSYSADTSANFRRAAYYVDRILKGAKPGDLPIEQPTKFDLVINMKTAKTLGLEIPRDLAVRADRVIE